MTLTNNYNRLIEHVNVTPDMLVRLHEALDSGKYPRTAAHRNLRRYAALAACLAVIIGGASLLNRQPADNPVQTLPPTATGEVTEYDSTDELAEHLSFALRLPTALPKGYECMYAANSFGTAALRYDKGEDSIRYFMGEGESAFEGIYPSGEKRTLTAENAAVYADNGGYIVEWTTDGFSYALLTTEAFSDDELCAIIESVR